MWSKAFDNEHLKGKEWLVQVSCTLKAVFDLNPRPKTALSLYKHKDFLFSCTATEPETLSGFGCCSDPVCSIKFSEVRRDLDLAREKIEALKLRLAEWHTVNR